MSGLLQRLAWRALGRPSTIRPIVGRIVAVAERHSPPPGERHAAALALHSAPASEMPEILPARTEASGDADDRGRQAGAPARQVSAAVLPPGESTRAPGDVLLAEERHAQAAPPVQSTQASHSAGWNDDETGATTETAAARGAASLRVEAARTGRRSAQGMDIDGDTAAARVFRPAAAQPSANDAIRGLRGASRVVPAATRDDVTEVHVTIGRIELTAAPPATRPRREPARPRKAQSLDEYLARREAGRR